MHKIWLPFFHIDPYYYVSTSVLNDDNLMYASHIIATVEPRLSKPRLSEPPLSEPSVIRTLL